MILSRIIKFLHLLIIFFVWTHASAVTIPKVQYDTTFINLILPYLNHTERICANDTIVIENMAFTNKLRNLELLSYLKTNNSLLTSIALFEKENDVYYGISNFHVFKQEDCYICIFYINAAWDHSRSLVYVVYDYNGNELYSKILSTEDKLLNYEDQYYVQTSFCIHNDLLDLKIYYRSGSYKGMFLKLQHTQYQINTNGFLLECSDNNYPFKQ